MLSDPPFSRRTFAQRHRAIIPVSSNPRSTSTTRHPYSLFDSPALFGRDIRKFEGMVGTWTGQKSDHYEKVRRFQHSRLLINSLASNRHRLLDRLPATSESNADGIDRQLRCRSRNDFRCKKRKSLPGSEMEGERP